MRYTLLLFLFINSFVYCQKLHHQMVSSQGTSVELYNGFYISQTIGQQSVIGNYTKNGYTNGQGFQQKLWSKYINSNITSEITTTTYPNPFIRYLNFQFSRPIKDVINVNIFDMRGRLIFQEEKRSNESILTIELDQLPSGSYFVRLSTPNYLYYTQIIRPQ